ncbi:hypothetical protein MTO96_038840 [Rhipicephalus appendiculatus]
MAACIADPNPGSSSECGTCGLLASNLKDPFGAVQKLHVLVSASPAQELSAGGRFLFVKEDVLDTDCQEAHLCRVEWLAVNVGRGETLAMPGAGLDTGVASAAAELPAESLALRWVKLERDVLDTVCHEALVHWLELLTVLTQDDHCETLGSPEVRFKINLAPLTSRMACTWRR